MKILSDILESTSIITTIEKEDLENYIKIVKKDVSRDVLKLLNYLYEYNILSSTEIDFILNKPENISSNKYNIPIEVIKDIKKLKFDDNFIPLYQDPVDFQSILRGTKTLEDVTLDLQSPKGRENIAKKYIPLVLSIATKYASKGFNRDDAISAGMEGLTLAMNDYHRGEFVDGSNTSKEETIQKKSLPFKQYVAWRIKQRILGDIQTNSRTVKMSQHMTNKAKSEGRPLYNTVSIDTSSFGDDKSNFSNYIDNIVYLQSKGDINSIRQKEIDDLWSKIFDILDKKYSKKNINNLKIFLMKRGLNGYGREDSRRGTIGLSSEEIRKKLGIDTSVSYMSQIDKSILKFLFNDKNTRRLLDEIRDIYTESLIRNNIKKDIIDVLSNDSTYLFLENITRWSTSDKFDNEIGTIINEFDQDSSQILENCLIEGLDYIDSVYDKYKALLLEFISKVHPTEYFKDDISIIDKISDLSKLYNEYHD